MRKLMWISLGFGLACILGAYFLTSFLPLIGVFSALIAFGVGFFLRKHLWSKRVMFFLIGCAAGVLWFHAFSAGYLNEVQNMDGKTVHTTALCTAYSEHTDYGTVVEGVIKFEKRQYRVRFYLNGEIDIAPGDQLRGSFSFSSTVWQKYSGYNASEGVFLLARQESDCQLRKDAAVPLLLYPAVMRKNLINRIDEFFPKDAAPFARALLLGDRSGIDYETNTAFRVSGISHVIAVSGLHVTILFSLIYVLCLKKRVLTAIFGIVGLVLFAAIAGFSPSVVRACIMQILVIVGMLLDLDYDPPTALSFSALVMMLINPLVIASVSFQLSVSCMAGIFLFNGRIYNYLSGKLPVKKKGIGSRLKRWLLTSVSVPLSAMSLTTPLIAMYFGTVSLAGVLTNLLTLWIISFIFYGIMLVCAVSFLLPGIAALLAGVVAWPIRYVLAVCKIMAGFPLAAVYTRSIYVVCWLVLAYVLLVIFLLSRKKRPAVLASCCALGLGVALLLSWVEPSTDSCRMTVLDVGQGQSIILHSDGKTYLVDCGGSYQEGTADLAAETLLSQGISRLDGIIVTHYDLDHAGALPYLLTRISADALFLPDSEDPQGVGEALEKQTGLMAYYVSDPLEISYGETQITIFGPLLTDSDNENSLCILFQKENCDILITGDRSDFGERMLLRQAEIPELDILVAGHHGSKNSTAEALLQATKPHIVAISVGENYYGHPSPELLSRLEDYGCIVYRTDLDGNLIFRR